jgi:hypothetical protein
MPVVLSNQLKAILVTEDITEPGVNVWQDNCFIVQHFHYECRRKRNVAGEPYGDTVPSYLFFTVKVVSEGNSKVFFERMRGHDTFRYSFLFNASFNSMRGLSEYQDALVASGYLVDLEELYESAPDGSGVSDQMLIRAKLLLSNLAYVGQESILRLMITND